jgi:sortase (surface protein transpeptidase)
MTTTTPPANSRVLFKNGPHSSTRWWVAAVVLLLIGAGLLTVGLLDHQNTLPDLAASPSLASPPSASHSTPAPTSTTSTTLPRSVPTELRIPAIGLTSSLSTLGLNPDRTIQVPTNYRQPGWFRLGPSPGQIGSAVILGHVDDQRGPAVFFRLRSLKPGDKVEVSLANGVVAQFVVTKVTTYLKAAFPAQQVYASHGYSALQLVTCGGQFDTRSGHYLSNVVAYTTLVTTTPSSSPPSRKAVADRAPTRGFVTAG